MLARIDAARAHPSPGIQREEILGSLVCEAVCLGASRPRYDPRSQDRENGMRILQTLTHCGHSGAGECQAFTAKGCTGSALARGGSSSIRNRIDNRGEAH